jgi:hypothetical protein
VRRLLETTGSNATESLGVQTLASFGHLAGQTQTPGATPELIQRRIEAASPAPQKPIYDRPALLDEEVVPAEETAASSTEAPETAPPAEQRATAPPEEQAAAEPAASPATQQAENAPAAEQSAGAAGAAQESGPVADAPSASYIVPFDRHPVAAPGERIIFRGDFTDPSPGDYQLEYSTTGGHFNAADGATTVTIAGLTSGNVNFFVPRPWDGTTAVQVVLKVKKKSDNSVTQSETWDFALKARYPTTITQVEGTGETNLPGIYTYDIGPALATGHKPFYEHQTILERFSNWSLANIAPADIAPDYRKNHSLDSTAAITRHFLGDYAGNNGTFTVNADDRIGDQHGGHPDLSNLVSNLAAPKDIEVALPQTYEAKPGTALGNFTITRILKADGTTWKVKKAKT